MSQKSNITIVLGLLLFAATLLVSIFVFIAFGASGPEIMDSPQKQAERGQLAGTIQTTFVFVAVLELVVTGMLAYKWRNSDISDQPRSDDREENRKKTSSTLVWFSAFASIIAFVTSYIASLLDVFVYDIYGGLSLITLICTGIPAGLFGMLGGFIWCKVTRRSKFTSFDLVPITLIGIIAGIIPGACVKLLPQ